MSEENEVKTPEETSNAVPAGPAAGIARGRMHAALVFAIKFGSGEAKDGEIARKFATTPGKVNDIRKDRNFKYVVADMQFTAAEIQEAKDRFSASVSAENSTVAEDDRVDTIDNANAALDALTATDGDSQLATARKADRKPRGKSGEDAEGEGDGAEAEVASTEGDEDLDAMLEG